MRKSYFANTVEAALALARQELGDETLLIDSRRTSREARHLGVYEVIVEAAPEAPAKTSPPGLPGTPKDDLDRVAREMEGLRAEMKRLEDAVRRSVAFPGAFEETSGLTTLAARLAAADLSADAVRELLARTGRAARGGNGTPTESDRWHAAGEVCRQMFEVAAPYEPKAGARKIIAVAGPPGAGKTSLLVKLAMHYSLRARRPAALISADYVRIAAADQLRCYAAILGLPFFSAETAGGLALLLDELKNKELVFLDTPGLSPREMAAASGLAELLSGHSEVETHLVLTSGGRTADLLDAAERWSIFRPHCLAFTKLDETTAYGPMFAVAARCGLPISFLTNGQRIPEDFEFASERRILDLLLGAQPACCAAAA